MSPFSTRDRLKLSEHDKAQDAPSLKNPTSRPRAEQVIAVSYVRKYPTEVRLTFDFEQKKAHFSVQCFKEGPPVEYTMHYELIQAIMVGLIVSYNRLSKDDEIKADHSVQNCITDTITRYNRSETPRLFSSNDDHLRASVMLFASYLFSTLTRTPYGDLFPKDEPLRSRDTLKKMVQHCDTSASVCGNGKRDMLYEIKEAWRDTLKEYKSSEDFTFAIKVMAWIQAKKRENIKFGGPFKEELGYK